MDWIESWLLQYPPIIQALYAGLFTWGVTGIGSAFVFFTKKVNQKFLNTMLGFAAGVMIAASVWSLIIPSIEQSTKLGYVIPWVPAAIGFILGGVFLRICDAYIPHLHLWMPREKAEGITTSWKRATLLIGAITLHNIPEGLAIGVLFGAITSGDPDNTTMIGAAVALALGIGLQNFPEGMAVSIPLRREGMGVFKSFWYGQLSGIVEPISSVIGAAAVIFIEPIQPYSLAFAAGAMIFVVIEELIPESQKGNNTDAATLGTMGGFLFMMILDISLG